QNSRPGLVGRLIDSGGWRRLVKRGALPRLSRDPARPGGGSRERGVPAAASLGRNLRVTRRAGSPPSARSCCLLIFRPQRLPQPSSRGTRRLMLARVRSGALRGIDALVVDVEVDVSSGLPHTTTVGLPDGAVREGTERIRAALRNCGFKHAERRVTVNLGPAGVRKEGAAFDLPIALGLLAAFGDFDLPDLSRWCVLGELGLDGRVHRGRGALPITAAARQAALGGLIVPAPNAAEAALAGGPPVFGVETLADAVAHLRGEVVRAPTTVDAAA